MSEQQRQRTTELFEDALRETPAQRTQFLKRACAGDAALLAELKSLIEEYELSGDSTLRPVPNPPQERDSGNSLAVDTGEAVRRIVAEQMLGAGDGQDSDQRFTAFCPNCQSTFDDRTRCSAPACANTLLHYAFAGPAVIDGRYRVQKRLGEGGMGIVFLASEEQLGRQVAVKVIKERAIGGRLTSVLREAKALGTLEKCRQIVSVHHSGIDPRGLAYIVMEYVDGAPLSHFVAPGGIEDLDWIIRVLEQVAQAVDFSHQRNLLHLDLKPGNVLVSADTEPMVKVLDFGLAIPADTSESALGGTYAYMAPEVLLQEPPSRANDIYGLGVITYELLAGSVPYGVTREDVETNWGKPLRPPSLVKAAIPRELDAPVLAMLHPDFGQRPASARIAVAAVKQALSIARLRSWRRREYPLRAAVAFLLTLLLVPLSSPLSRTTPMEAIENWAVDARFQLARSKAPDKRIIVVSFDRASSETDSRPFRERADEFSSLFQELLSNGARTIAFDLLLHRQWASSQSFTKLLLKNHHRLVLGLTFDGTTPVGVDGVAPLAAMALGDTQYRGLFGSVDVEHNSDGVVRQIDCHSVSSDETSMKFALLAVKKSELGAGPPVCEEGRFWIDHSVDWTAMPNVKWTDFLSEVSNDPYYFRNRIVFVGADSVVDRHNVPTAFGRPSQIPGVALHALIANTALANYPVRDVPRLLANLILCGLVGICLLLGLCLRSRRVALGSSAALTLVSWIGAGLIFMAFHRMLPVTQFSLAIALGCGVAFVVRLFLRGFPSTTTGILEAHLK